MTMDAALLQAFETSWPAAEYRDAGGYRIGRGLGGGGRISSARPLQGQDAASTSPEGIAAAVATHEGWDQTPLFRLWDGDADHARALSDAGLSARNPTLVMASPLAPLTDTPTPLLTVFQIWPPLAVLAEIWQAGAITPARQAAMHRVNLPATTLLGRMDDHASAAAFAAVDGDVAMIHALEVEPRMRGRGLGGWMIREAAFWAQAQGATRLALAVTEANAPAVGLYRKLGFETVGRYSYWSA